MQQCVQPHYSGCGSPARTAQLARSYEVACGVVAENRSARSDNLLREHLLSEGLNDSKQDVHVVHLKVYANAGDRRHVSVGRLSTRVYIHLE